MDVKLFNELMKEPPSQHPPEFLTFLEMCETYLNKFDIKNPVVVELGVYYDKQKRFYEQLLGAEHIGIDAGSRRAMPDILGNTHDPETMRKLKEKLNGRLINILFIDASHHYDDVKQDFEMYFPLCNGIVGFHDIETGRYQTKKRRQVWKFWDELKMKTYTSEEYSNYLFVSIRQHRKKIQMGIGMIIRKWEDERQR